MKIDTKLIIPVFFISVFIIATGILLQIPNKNDPNSNNQYNLGFAKPFDAINTKGEIFSLNSLLGKKMIIIDFMATWCQPCREIGAVYTDILNDYSENISIVSISTFHLDSIDILANWSTAWGFEWTFIPYGNKTENIINLYGGIDEGIPLSFFIDQMGIIRTKHLGSRLNYISIENWINGKYS